MTRARRLALLASGLALIGGIGVVSVLGSRPEGSPPVSDDTRATPTRTASDAAAPPRPSGYSHLYTREATNRYRRALKLQGETFFGTINGITVPRNAPTCADLRPMSPEVIQEHQLPEPSWLPPGAVEWRQRGWHCGEDLHTVERSYQFKPWLVYLTVARVYQRDHYILRAGKDRVSPGRIRGRPALFVRPVTPEGNGNSWILFKDGTDLILFEGLDITFEDLRAAARSLAL